jgi:hypothetical protein
MNAEFLARLSWVKVLLDFEVVDALELPAFCGPTFRGALGHAFRPALCQRRPPCRSQCAAPENCHYYALFEQSRARGGSGVNIPKPMILEVPVPEELKAIIEGGPVCFPYRVGGPSPGASIPSLNCEHELRVPPGARVTIGLAFLGQVSAAMQPVVEFLSRRLLSCAKGRLLLRRVIDADGSGRPLFDRQISGAVVESPRIQSLGPEQLGVDRPVRRLRVLFYTPTLVKLGNSVCFEPEKLAQVFAEHCLVRAVQVYNAFFAPQGEKLPRLSLPDLQLRLVGHRLFRYVLPRLSFRQDRWMRFDGVVGYLDLEGDLTPAMPFVRAAEILHFGQKATFGLGQVKCVCLDP